MFERILGGTRWQEILQEIESRESYTDHERTFSGNTFVGTSRNLQDGISGDLDVHGTRSGLDDGGTHSIHVYLVRKRHGSSHASLRFLLRDMCIEYEVLEPHKTALDCAPVAYHSALVDITEILEHVPVRYNRSRSRSNVSVGNHFKFSTLL